MSQSVKNSQQVNDDEIMLEICIIFLKGNAAVCIPKTNLMYICNKHYAQIRFRHAKWQPAQQYGMLLLDNFSAQQHSHHDITFTDLLFSLHALSKRKASFAFVCRLVVMWRLTDLKLYFQPFLEHLAKYYQSVIQILHNQLKITLKFNGILYIVNIKSAKLFYHTVIQQAPKGNAHRHVKQVQIKPSFPTFVPGTRHKLLLRCLCATE